MTGPLRRLSLGHVWAIAAIAAIAGDVSARALDPADFWHYLEAGRFMVQSGTLLDYDRYSFTILGQPFVNLHWGSQVLFYLGYALGGIPLLAFVHAVAMGVAFALVLATAQRRVGSLRMAALATVVAFFVAAPCLALRPQSLSILCFALTMFLVDRRWPWPLPVVFLVWANVHAAFPVGLMLVGIAACTPRPAQDSEPGDHGPAPVQRSRRATFDVPMLAVLAASVAATFVTPWGSRLYPAVLAAGPASRAAFIDEWMPISVLTLPGLVFFTALVGLLVGRAHLRRGWSLRDACTLVAFTYLALTAQRALVWWAFAAAPSIAATVAAAARARADRTRLAVLADEQAGRGDRLALNWLLVAALTVHVAYCTPWLKPYHPLLPAPKRALLTPDTPVAMARVLARAPGTARLFAEMGWAGYFSWALGDRCRVFYDSRVVIFPRAVVTDYVRTTFAHVSWERTLEDAGVGALALSKELQPLLIAAASTSPHWTLLYEDDHGVAFVRRERPAGTPPGPVPPDDAPRAVR